MALGLFGIFIWSAAGMAQEVISTEQTAPGFFASFKQQMRGAWYALRFTLPVDQALYEDYSEDRLARLEKRFENWADQLGSRKEEIRQAIRRTQQSFESLKEAESSETRRAAKNKFESTLTESRGLLRSAVDDSLTDKDVYDLDAEDKVVRLRYDLKELNSAYQLARVNLQKSSPEVEGYGTQIHELLLQTEGAQTQLERLRKSEVGKWQLYKGDIEARFFSIRENYYDLVALVAPLYSNLKAAST